MELKITKSNGLVQITLQGQENSEEIQQVLRFLEAKKNQIWAWDEKQRLTAVLPEHIIWGESIEEKLFLYSSKEMYRSSLTLRELTELWKDAGFFRCGKSIFLNLYKIKSLQSVPGGRILAFMSTQEKIYISRRYVPILRKIIKGE